MAKQDWDLGEKQDSVLLSPSRTTGGDPGDRLEEYFEVTRYAKGVVVRAVRPLDHVDLCFTIPGYTCIGLGAEPGPVQLPRIVPKGGRDGGFVAVDFPPQHIAEQIRATPTTCGDAGGWGASRIRMSGKSRLVFEIPKDSSWRRGLEIAELTDWAELVPVVNARAAAAAAGGAVEQLAIGFPKLKPKDFKTLDVATALTGIAGALHPPDIGETALEMAGRLILSPSEESGWMVPALGRGAAEAPLWSARLDRRGRAGVRAIWSKRMQPGRIPADQDDPEDDITKQPMLSLSFAHHWEIVAQTSVYGLPALRKLGDSGKNSPDGPAAGVPRSGVERPHFDVGYLDEAEQDFTLPAGDAGIAIATPFVDADIGLTALGGVFSADWNNDPATLLLKQFPVLGFNLERLSYSSWLGRDCRVVAVDKGYLFPLGIRASLVTLHERHIYPDAKGDPVSYLVRRKFIVSQRRAKSYPGPYQPYAGREFPATQVAMRTLVTPDLVEPIENIRLGHNPVPESIFWPTVADLHGNPAHFMFEWTTEDATVVKSRLIFVKNAPAKTPELMRQLVAYYEGLAEPARTALVGGARHRYAKSLLDGDTSFDTLSWLLAATGRRDGPDGAEHFTTDARMEGADQPPFYPRLAEATLSVQTIAQMMGAPQGPVRAAYFQDYLDHGFDTEHGIFLRLLTDSLTLPASAGKERSGGIVSPDLRVGALSRSKGLIGGSKARALAGVDGPVDISDAVDGKFNPAQFFEDATLLGIVKLADLLELADLPGLDKAPNLVEHLTHGARQTLELVQDAARLACDALYGTGGGGLVGSLEAAIRHVDDVLLKDAGFKLEHIYSALLEALKPLRDGTLRTDLDALIAATDPVAAREAIGRLGGRVRDLVRAIATALSDPVPDIFETVIDAIKDLFAAVLRGWEEVLRIFVRDAIALFHAWLKDAFCAAIDQEGFGRILFGEQGGLSCDELFKSPQAALAAFAEGFYGEAFAKALGGANALIGHAADFAARLTLDAGMLEARIVDTVTAATWRIEDRLLPFDPALDDIRSAARKAQLADEIMRDIEQLIAPPAAPSLDAALRFARALPARFERDAEAAIVARIDALLPAIRAAAGIDPRTLLAELKTELLRRLKDALVAPLAAEAEALHDRLTRLAGELAEDGFARVVDAVAGAFDALASSAEAAALARAGRKVAKVCADVQAAAIVLADGVMAASAAIDAAAQDVAAAAGGITIPPGVPGQRIQAAIDALTAAAGAVSTLNARMQAERVRLLQAGSTLCASAAAYLDPIAALLRLRAEALGELRRIAREAAEIALLFETSNPSNADRQALGRAARGCADLCLGVTGAEGIGAAGNHQTLSAAVRTVMDAGIGAQTYVDSLQAVLTEALARAAAVRKTLAGPVDPSALLGIIEADVELFARRFDRSFAALLIQCVGFTDTILAAIEAAVGKVAGALARLILPLYDAIDSLLAHILDLYPDGSVLEAILAYALGGAGKIQAIRQARTALAAEKAKVQALANSPDVQALRELIDSYRSGSGALALAVEAIRGLAFVDVGQHLTTAIRAQLKRIEEEIGALLRQVVPTKIETRYSWNTALKRWPDKEDEWAFKMNASSERDLVIDSRFTFDIVTKERTASVTGTLEPFKIRLLGKLLDMVTIGFARTSFTSVNGSAPKFDMKVESVEFGSYLKYIQQLQSWLSPQGSGFYARPAPGFDGIEAGYVYDASLIQLGSLQFINVSFRVAAILPFSIMQNGEQDARFVLALGGPESPFLISSPPYGGGGWVELTCNASEVVGMDVALVFGGASALQFGPLRAQARVLAGVRVQLIEQDRKRGYVFTAIFEAVGEGSIACFSISVSIRITLTQRLNGSLVGEATYRFKFKVGFASFKYKVTARYTLSNGSGGGAASLLARACPGGTAWLRSNIPLKEQEWGRYRRHFDLTLLEDAA